MQSPSVQGTPRGPQRSDLGLITKVPHAYILEVLEFVTLVGRPAHVEVVRTFIALLDSDHEGTVSVILDPCGEFVDVPQLGGQAAQVQKLLLAV